MIISKRILSNRITLSLILFGGYTAFLYAGGYFSTGLMSDDYLNFIASVTTDTVQKFTSSVPGYNPYHFRPLWFLSMEYGIYFNKLLNITYDNFIFFRIENLILFYALVFSAAELSYKLTDRIHVFIFTSVLILLYPNNNINLFWTTGKVDILCALMITLSLLFTLKFFKTNKKIFAVLSALFFLSALLTKETAIVLPFILLIAYLFFSYFRKSTLRKFILFQFFVLAVYFIIRIIILSGNISGVSSQYLDPGMLNFAGVYLKALVSLTVPFDYLSIRNGIYNFDLILLFSFLFFILFFAYLLLKIKKENSVRSVYFLICLFAILILPNLAAGYFRPQLILIPFVLIAVSASVLLKNTIFGYRKVLIKAGAYILFCAFINFANARDWNMCHELLKKSVSILIDDNLSSEKINYIIGLPSRYKSVYITDYAAGPYNYFKYRDFVFKDKNIVDYIHTGALDISSLNSGIKFKKSGKNLFEAEVQGKSQYLLKLDVPESSFHDNETQLEFLNYNILNKPTKAIFNIHSDSDKIYFFSLDGLIEQNDR